MSVVHPFPPVADAACRVLILGSFPSVKSREEGFFYGHPRNRFWPLMAALLGENAPQSIPEKKAMLLRHHIALWDVIASCEITGSSDSSVKNAVPVDIAQVTELCPWSGSIATARWRRSCITAIWKTKWACLRRHFRPPAPPTRPSAWRACGRLGG